MAAALHRLRLLARLDELIVRLEVRLSERRMEPEDGAAAGADMARLRGRARLAERRLALLDGRWRVLLTGVNGSASPGLAPGQRAARGSRRG
jgi:hypothetical protein